MIIFTLVVLILDIVSKVIVRHHLELNTSYVIIKKFLNITYVKNTGAAFSIFDDNSILVFIMSLIIIVLIIYYVYRNRPKNILSKIGYAFIIGGAIGNLLDRILYGYVVDFIDIKIFNYDYPIFNLADIFIVVGVILEFIYAWRCSDGNKGFGQHRIEN